MQKPALPKWIHAAMLALAVVLVLFGLLAWSNEYRIQSATLFSFGLLLAIQWFVTRSRATSERA